MGDAFETVDLLILMVATVTDVAECMLSCRELSQGDVV